MLSVDALQVPRKLQDFCMFIDKVSVTAKAGDGGDGRVSFRHEKFIDRGGPDGGDGGKGGDIIFLASRNQNTLAAFRFQKELKAQEGQAGGKQRMHGRNGQNLVVAVPVGTVVTTQDGAILADLHTDEQTAVIAKGGGGGFGNAHFVSSRRQAPKFSEKGELGIFHELNLELKMIADVALVGLPNAGKSTLLSVVSNAKPEIADYPFTTLIPNLGVVDVDQDSLLFADVPGLIEGASAGKGLGHDFLRHIERTAVILHLVDAYSEDIQAVYKTIRNELKTYKADLDKRPEIVVITKIEGLDDVMLADMKKQLRKVVPKGTEIFAISATSHLGLDLLLRKVRDVVKAVRALPAEKVSELDGLPVISMPASDDDWVVARESKDTFLVTGKKIEQFAARTDYENEEGVARLRNIMSRLGIMHELRRLGIEPDMTILIGESGSFLY